MNRLFRLSAGLLCLGTVASGQSNTAITSGSIGKCAVWNYPYTLYNTSAASQAVNDGVTVTVDQDRNFGAVNLSGSGAMDMSGANGITLSGSGTEINCRWDIGNYGSNVVTNNNGVFSNNSQGQAAISKDLGTFFNAPYAGVYRWVMGSGWAANMSGAYLSGSVGVRKQGNDHFGTAFLQNQPGSCGMSVSGSTVYAPTFFGTVTPVTLTAGQGVSYAASSAYTSGSTCNNTQLFFTIGTASMFYEN